MDTSVWAPFFVFLTICTSRLSGRLINTFVVEPFLAVFTVEKLGRCVTMNHSGSFPPSGRTGSTLTGKSEGGYLGWGGNSPLELSYKCPCGLPLQCRNGKVCPVHCSSKFFFEVQS